MYRKYIPYAFVLFFATAVVLYAAESTRLNSYMSNNADEKVIKKAFLKVGPSSIIVGLGVVWIESNDLIVIIDCLIMHTHFVINNTSVKIRSYFFWFQSNSVSICLNCSRQVSILIALIGFIEPLGKGV